MSTQSALHKFLPLLEQHGIACITGLKSPKIAMTEALTALQIPLYAKAMVISPESDKRAAAGIVNSLRAKGIAALPHAVEDSWPVDSHVQALASNARRVGCSLIIAIGGADTINLGKAVALRTNNATVQLGGGDLHQMPDPSLPFLAWPTVPTSVATTRRSMLVKNDGGAITLLPNKASKAVAVLNEEFATDADPKLHWCSILEGISNATEATIKHNEHFRGFAYQALFKLLVSGVHFVAAGGDLKRNKWHGESLFAHALLGLVSEAGDFGPTDALATVLADRYKLRYAEAAAHVGPEVFEWAAEVCENKAAEEDDDDAGSSAIPRGFVTTARAKILESFDIAVVKEQMEFAANEISGHNYGGGTYTPAVGRLADIRHLLRGFFDVPSFEKDCAAGWKQVEARLPAAAQRESFKHYALTRPDVQSVAGAAEVHSSAANFIQAPSTRQLVSILEQCTGELPK